MGRVYETVRRQSVCPPVCPIRRSYSSKPAARCCRTLQWRAAGLLLWDRRVGDINRLLRLICYMYVSLPTHTMLPCFPVLHFLPPVFSGPAFSTHAIWSRVFQSCLFHPRIFHRPAFSIPAFSASPIAAEAASNRRMRAVRRCQRT